MAPPEQHGLNFCFPIPAELRSERVRLTPFDPTRETEPFFAVVRPSGISAQRARLLDTALEDLRTEIGFVVTLLRFRRTHVTSHAIGLLLHWALDVEDLGCAASVGMGMRAMRKVYAPRSAWASSERAWHGVPSPPSPPHRFPHMLYHTFQESCTSSNDEVDDTSTEDPVNANRGRQRCPAAP
ncbi:hypothetical protein C8R44DRAFT_865255 [Mycena epipterygia]|nr:hypothetical protein C8R44DRAFT_865255 [Mycena epipterygia]